MSKWIIFVLLMILCILMVICYALLVAASDADDQAEKLQDLKTRKKPFKSVWVDEDFNELGEGEDNE